MEKVSQRRRSGQDIKVYPLNSDPAWRMITIITCPFTIMRRSFTPLRGDPITQIHRQNRQISLFIFDGMVGFIKVAADENEHSARRPEQNHWKVHTSRSIQVKPTH